MNYLRNLAHLALGQRLLDPLVAIYYVTTHCNLRCAYCEDFGVHRNAENEPPAPLEDAKRILGVIRSGVDSLWLTGGEPLLAPHLAELLEYAKRGLRFRQTSLITNGMLLPSRQDILPHLDRLVISLDSLDPSDWGALNMPNSYAESILDIVLQTASQQGKYGFRLILNTVLTPETIEKEPGNPFATFLSLIDFCTQYKIWISFSPQSTNNWPRYELAASQAYRKVLSELAARKKRGAPILCSNAYLDILSDNRPYDCYPSLAPRIMPNGDLAYPCRPIEKAGGEQGGRPVNLLHVPDWKTAIKTAREAYGEPPSMCVSCFQQCYAEPSLMQARPFDYLRERKSLATYVPG